ncbi:MAG: intradiol ring-cleavage dioxygenase [Chloroflexi bacterium OHK40]
MKHETPDIYDLGLAADLQMLQRSPITRRRLLSLGAAGLTSFLTGCALAGTQAGGSDLPLVAGTTAATADTAAGAAACVAEIPQETAGPYPADGSNASNQTLNVLTRSGIVRRDLRSSLSTGNTAAGIPLTLVLTLVDSSRNCAPLAGYAIYAWHCTREGGYSLYSNGLTSEDYLRGVQATDSAGVVTFTTIYPGCYAGRWPHVHFEIYRTLDEATSAANVLHTSQLAFPQDVCERVYATDGYAESVRNLAQISLETDNVFRDGYSSQLATVTGDVTSGYTAQLTIGIEG